MAGDIKLNRPWLVAVWPGMGHVAISAGYYLVAKLGMHILAEFAPQEVFDVEHVEVKEGLIRMGRLPRSRFFVWRDPRERHDIVVFIGEAQPSKGRYVFCQRLIDFARQLGIERVYTFAAMATPMHPGHACRVFGAATDPDSLAELEGVELEILEDGQIGGLNGVLLGVAAEGGLHGACLLGEMPHIFHQLPFPKASLSVLQAFSTIADIHIDLSELAEQAKDVEQKLGELLEKLQEKVQEALEGEQEPDGPGEEDGPEFEPAAMEEGPNAESRELIENLFRQAYQNRAKAYELKSELDRLGLYREYEDRFLDLFKKPG
jgi:uncharacterized protein